MQQHWNCLTHILCYINRTRWAGLAGDLLPLPCDHNKGILFLFSTPTHTEIAQTFSPWKVTNTMPNPPTFTKTHRKRKFRRNHSPQTPPTGLPKAQRHCSQGALEERGNTGWLRFSPMAGPPWHFLAIIHKMNTITVTSQFPPACRSGAPVSMHGDRCTRRRTTGQ